MRRVCVFCGSCPGARPAYAAAARRLADELVRRGHGLVYGGGRVGLMGILADAVLERGGEVIGVIPQALARKEVAHAGLTRLHVVGSMHERKATMAELCDAFVALPGGYGTLEEFCEVLTWAQLGMHAKPCGLLDVEGYWEPLLAQLDRALREGFVGAPQRGLVLVESGAAALLDRFESHRPPATPRWIRTGES